MKASCEYGFILVCLDIVQIAFLGLSASAWNSVGFKASFIHDLLYNNVTQFSKKNCKAHRPKIDLPDLRPYSSYTLYSRHSLFFIMVYAYRVYGTKALVYLISWSWILLSYILI